MKGSKLTSVVASSWAGAAGVSSGVDSTAGVATSSVAKGAASWFSATTSSSFDKISNNYVKEQQQKKSAIIFELLFRILTKEVQITIKQSLKTKIPLE